ncbi:MAG: tRNA 2-thiouridine(34) synthase MnmA, partial [Rhodospirillaceae bacterium]|nr:tRNA 2-thiouridine(34) synthase MnmA [Rhodospirillaceae bacterium]
LIERLRPGAAEPGDLVDLGGQVLGQHNGVIHYTVGQRKGLGLSGPEPLYVLKLDATARRVVVGPKSALAKNLVKLHDVNWLDHEAPCEGRVVQARIRSTHPPVDATLNVSAAHTGVLGVLGVSGEGSGVELAVELVKSEDAVAPGQACVIYDGARVLGGGWIARS